MNDDSQVNLNVLRSVIDSYRKRKEGLEKREEEVKERLAEIRAGRIPRRDESTIEINIQTRESILRATSDANTPTDSYLPSTYSQNEACVQGPGELLFHSKYCAYKDSDKSINEQNSRELINNGPYNSILKKTNNGKSKFSYKNFDEREDIDLESDTEDVQNVNMATRKEPKKRGNTNSFAEQRDPRAAPRKYDKQSRRTRGSSERVPVSDESRSQVDLSAKMTSEAHSRYKKTNNATPCKTDEAKMMDYTSERLSRIGLVRDVDDRTMAERFGNDKRIKTNGLYSRYEEDERRESSRYFKQGKSSRKTSNRETNELRRHPALMEILRGYAPGTTLAAPERKNRRSHTPDKKALTRKDSYHNFVSNRDHHGYSLRRPIKTVSSTSESGCSISQGEASERKLALRRVDSCNSSDDEHVRSRSPLYRGYERRSPHPHSPAPAERLKMTSPTNCHASMMPSERGYPIGGRTTSPYFSREDREVRPHSQPRNRGSPTSRLPIREGYIPARGLERSPPDLRAGRPHSPAERLNAQGGLSYVGRSPLPHLYRENHDERHQSRCRSAGPTSARSPTRVGEGYRSLRPRSPEQQRTPRPLSPAERPNDGRSPSPYCHLHNVERCRSPTRGQNQHVFKTTTVDNDEMSKNVNGFDEDHSNKFLVFLIENSLPRAMSPMLVTSNEFNSKRSQEVINSVHEVTTIKKLICDELDRRETIGRPFKLPRRDKERLMMNFAYAKQVQERLESGFSVREALSISQTKSLESSMQLHERTMQAIRQANQILGGDLPDPADADDLEKAAEECLRNLAKLHMETVSNYPFPGLTANELRGSTYHTLPDQYLATENTCKSCREDWFTSELNRLKDAILNIEEHMKNQSIERATNSRQPNEVNQYQNADENGHSFPAARSYYQQKHNNDADETTTFNMPNALSHNPINNNSYLVHNMGNASYRNAYAGPSTNRAHRQR